MSEKFSLQTSTEARLVPGEVYKQLNMRTLSTPSLFFRLFCAEFYIVQTKENIFKTLVLRDVQFFCFHCCATMIRPI